MSRNGSGTMTVVNTFTPGNTITASEHNQNWADAASEITNSVAADGQTSMTGPLKASSGTAAAPSVSFSSDTDSGMYRIGANNVGVAVAGAKVLDVSATGLGVTGSLAVNGFSPLLVGEIKLWPLAAIPSGYLACNGASLLRASYPDLFTAIGTTFGAADGTHFTLPDMGGRVPAGKESSPSRLTATYFGGTSSTLGDVGGLESDTLTSGKLPASIPYTDTGHTHALDANSVKLGSGSSVIGSGGTATGLGGTSQSQSTGIVINPGGGAAHNNVQPTIILNYIIFAGV